MAKLLPPGYCIVEQLGPLAFQAQTFGGRTNDASRQFMAVNADSSWLKPGQIVLLMDQKTPSRLIPCVF